MLHCEAAAEKSTCKGRFCTLTVLLLPIDKRVWKMSEDVRRDGDWRVVVSHGKSLSPEKDSRLPTSTSRPVLTTA